MGEYLGKATRIMEEDYGLASFFPQVVAFDAFGNGLELLFNSLRGIRGLSLDIRRFPDKVEAAIEALNETFVKPRLEKAKKLWEKGQVQILALILIRYFFRTRSLIINNLSGFIGHT